MTGPDRFMREASAFVDQAHPYCDFIERAVDFPLPERLREARLRLLDLYRAGCVLPTVEPPEGFEAGPSPARPDRWEGFERFDTYWEVFDPYVDEAPVASSLSDDLMDVYFDVRRGLDLWESNAPRSAAIWEWRFHFDTHWGDHAVDALRALHRACHDGR